MATQRIAVAKVGDLKEGTMKEVPFGEGDGKVLLSNIGGKYYATSSKCTHYGAPLVKGVLTATGRIVCPWHGACFDACTGDIEDAPGLDNLTKFNVEVSDGQVFVTAPTEASKLTATRPPPSLSQKSSAGAGVVIIGGGPGTAFAIEQLRESGYKGAITVLSKEKYLPVDRTKLSKALIPDPSKVALRQPSFYESLKADFKLGTEAKKIDFDGEKVLLEGGGEVPYEYLIVATGATPSRLPLEGKELNNIFVMREVDDAAAIDKALGSGEDSKKNVVVIGSSFIGMEVAMAASKRANVTVVGMEEAPFQAVLGKEIGNGIRKFHEESGTKFYLPAQLSHFKASSSDPKAVGAIVLKDGTELPADVVVLGVGVKPATTLLKESGVSLEKDGSVAVDGSLRLKAVSKGNVFAIGDIATYPDYATGALTRVEHWNVAGNHGRTAAKVIAGKDATYAKQAVFWSAQGQQLRYVGTGKSKQWKDVIIKGDPNELKFVAYYTVGEEVVAVASMQNDPIVAHSSELLTLNKMPTASELKDGKTPLDVPLA